MTVIVVVLNEVKNPKGYFGSLCSLRMTFIVVILNEVKNLKGSFDSLRSLRMTVIVVMLNEVKNLKRILRLAMLAQDDIYCCHSERSEES
jgi:hypothetical protein